MSHWESALINCHWKVISDLTTVMITGPNVTLSCTYRVAAGALCVFIYVQNNLSLKCLCADTKQNKRLHDTPAVTKKI